MKKNSCTAFSLAEVLVTLAVIGVIATLTIPTLLQNKQKQDTVARLQKAYTTLAQAIKKSELDNGPLETWDYNDPTYFMNTYIAPYLNVIKKCSINESGCWASNNRLYHIKGSYESLPSQTRILLNDGTFLAFNTGDGHAHFYVDIDGSKGPSRFGRDVFEFTLTPTPLYDGHKIDKPGLYPYLSGADRSTITNPDFHNGCTKSGGGQACTSLIMLDGWQIKDDYPW